MFVNLSNHPLPNWPAGQQTAARSLGFGDVCEWPAGMPVVAPGADSAEVSGIAARLAAEVSAAGATGAFVATDYTLTFCLVLALQQRGVRCFSATSRRETVERARDDGSVEKVAVFRFVQWREYPER